MSQGVAQLLHVLEVTQEDLVVDRRPEESGLEEVDTVQVGDVDSPGVGLWALAPVLLDVHAEETDIHAVDLLESEQRPGAIGKLFRHVAVVTVPAKSRAGPLH